MDIIRPLHALGMSSGTALDGVDVALLKTDGVDVYDFGLSQSVPYDEELRDKIRSVLGKRPDTPENEAAIREVETELTAFHAEIANEIIAAQDEKVDVIGFEGHNICLDPKNHFSCQIGDGKRLAELTRTKVVNRFQNGRSAGSRILPVSLCRHGQAAGRGQYRRLRQYNLDRLHRRYDCF